jgi:hypothetical protein
VSYVAGPGAPEWRDLAAVVSAMTLQLQASDQAGLDRRPIFDPKATNLYLTNAFQDSGWRKIPVPVDLTEFDLDWDAGKGEALENFNPRITHFSGII